MQCATTLGCKLNLSCFRGSLCVFAAAAAAAAAVVCNVNSYPQWILYGLLIIQCPFFACIESLGLLTCLTKLLTRAVIMASHFLARDCFFFRGCCMEAPLSSVQEHLSAPLYVLCIHRYMGRSTSAPYWLSLNKKRRIPAQFFYSSPSTICIPWPPSHCVSNTVSKLYGFGYTHFKQVSCPWRRRWWWCIDMEPLVTVCQSKIKAIRLDEPLELDSHWEFVCSAKCIGTLQHIHIRAMCSIGLSSTVAFPLVAFQGTLSHGSEVSALAI